MHEPVGWVNNNIRDPVTGRLIRELRDHYTDPSTGKQVPIYAVGELRDRMTELEEDLAWMKDERDMAAKELK